MLSCAAGTTAHPAAASIQTRGSSRNHGQTNPRQQPPRAAPPDHAIHSSREAFRTGLGRPALRRSGRPRPTTLTPEEEARAAELEAQIVSEERQAEQAQRQARDRQQRAVDRDPVVRSAVPLSVREAEEYAYVARDVRRIATIAGGLFAIMIGLWIALQVSGVGAIWRNASTRSFLPTEPATTPSRVARSLPGA